jgi:hypothetical protein
MEGDQKAIHQRVLAAGWGRGDGSELVPNGVWGVRAELCGAFKIERTLLLVGEILSKTFN